MNRPLSLLLAALLILAPSCAMAADATCETYRDEAGGYTVDYPAGWTILSVETLQAQMDSLASGEAKIEGLDASEMEAYKARIEAMDTVVFMSSDGAVSASIFCQTVPEKFASDELVSWVYPAVLQQFQSVFADYAALSEPETERIGEREFVRTAGRYTLSGVKCVALQAYHCTDKNLYIITLTINSALNPDMNGPEAVLNAMLSSFEPD